MKAEWLSPQEHSPSWEAAGAWWWLVRLRRYEDQNLGTEGTLKLPRSFTRLSVCLLVLWWPSLLGRKCCSLFSYVANYQLPIIAWTSIWKHGPMKAAALRSNVAVGTYCAYFSRRSNPHPEVRSFSSGCCRGWLKENSYYVAPVPCLSIFSLHLFS